MPEDWGRVWAMTKLNLAQLKLVYLLFGGLYLIQIGAFCIGIISTLLPGTDYLRATFPVCFAGIFLLWVAAWQFSGVHLRKTMNLGGTRRDYYWSSLLTLVLLAVAGMILLVLTLTLSQTVIYTDRGFISGAEVNSDLIFSNLSWCCAVYAMVVLVTMVVYATHLIQGTWYGWVSIVMLFGLAALYRLPPLSYLILAIFTVNFCTETTVSMLICYLSSAGLYALCWPALKKKEM